MSERASDVDDRTGGVAHDRIVLVHGFTQTAASWDRVVALLTDRLRPEPDVVSVDAPGHGASADVRLGLADGARWLGEIGGRGTYVGYSMGGRLCLHLALERPDLVERLVLIGATPGIEDDAERTARRRRDDELAAELERDGLDDFLDRWLDQPLFATLPRRAAGIDERRTNTVAGLASSLRLAGTGRQASLWHRLGEVTAPTLIVVGALDEKFTAIGRRMVDSLPDVTMSVIPQAGHAVHLERPTEVGEAIIRWLAATASAAAAPPTPPPTPPPDSGPQRL